MVIYPLYKINSLEKSIVIKVCREGSEMQKSLLSEILKNCIPTMFSLTMVALYGVVDGLFVGNATGDTGLAAINISWPLIAVINAIGVTIGTAGSVLISFENGRGNIARSKEVQNITLTLIIAVSLTATLILLPVYTYILRFLGASGDVYTSANSYTLIVILGNIFQSLGSGIIPILRNKDKAVLAMVFMSIGTVVNIIVNYIFIFVLKMGVQGAALSTVFSQLLVAVMGAVVILRNDSFRFKLKVDELRRISKIGLATFGITVSPSIVLMFTNLQCIEYGGAAAVASYAVIAYIVFPVQSILTGVSNGVQPLISNCVGSGQHERLTKIKKIAFAILLVFAGMLTIAVATHRSVLGSWFGLSPQADKIFEVGILIYALSFAIVGIFKYNVSNLYAVLQTKKAIFLTYCESLLVTPIFIFTLPLLFGVTGIWLSFPATAITQMIIYLIVVNRDRKSPR